MQRCVLYHSNPNDLILDPFCGSGTTCVAAKMLGRNYIGIDISEEYCEIARQRLEAVETGVPVKEQRKGQMALFNETDKGTVHGAGQDEGKNGTGKPDQRSRYNQGIILQGKPGSCCCPA